MKKALVVIFIFLFSFLSFSGHIADCRNHFEAAQWVEKGIKDFADTKYDDAIKAFNKALDTHPNSAEAYYNRGLVYFWIGKWNQAIQDYSKAISLNPKEAKFFSSRGYAYASTRQDDQAIEDYNRAIALNPNDSESYLVRGVIYFGKGQYARKGCGVRSTLLTGIIHKKVGRSKCGIRIAPACR